LWESNCINWEIFEKFNICNIYWDKNAISNTSKIRSCLWDKLLNLHAKFISKSKSINGKLKLPYFRELKDKLGPELTTKFVDLAISNFDDKFILDFQDKNNLKNMNILFKVFKILHGSCFPISDFHEEAIQLIKNY
jgi:hypothetical protein